MSIIPKQNLIFYAPLDGHALDMSINNTPLSSTSLFSDSNLVAYYKCEDVNDSKGTRNLTNTNSVSFSSAKFGNGADMGASNTNKRLLYTTDSYGITTGAISISGWVKLNTEISSSSCRFFEHRNGANGISNYVEYDYNAGSRRINIGRDRAGVAVEVVRSTITLGTSEWYHFAMCYDGTTVEGYINGTSIGTVGSTGTGVAITDGFCIGATVNGFLFSSAIIDDVAVFNKRLSSSEISTIVGKRTGLNNGTVTGAIPVPSQNPAIPASLAYKFDASGSENSIKSNVAISASSNLTVSWWIYPTTNFDYNNTVTLGSLTAQTWGTFVCHGSSTGGVYCGTDIGTRMSPTDTPAFYHLNKWQFITYTHSGGVGTLYKNGVKVFSKSQTAPAGGTGLVLGAASRAGGGLDGKVQDVAIFNKALSAQEIQAIYNQSKKKYRSSIASIMSLLGTIYTLAMAQGSFTLTGIATTFTKTLNMLMSLGTFTLTGIDAAFQRARGILASTGTFVLTGIDATITSSRSLSLAVGSFTLTGIAAILEKIRGLAAQTGSFILTGYDIVRPQRWYKQNKPTTNWAKQSKDTTTWTKETK